MRKLFAGLLSLLPYGSVLANEAHDIMTKLPEEKRRVALSHVVRTSGESCSTVSRTFYQGSDKQGTAMWNAQCNTGRAYVVSFKNDARGTTKVLDCAVLKTVAGVNCFTKF